MVTPAYMRMTVWLHQIKCADYKAYASFMLRVHSKEADWMREEKMRHHMLFSLDY